MVSLTTKYLHVQSQHLLTLALQVHSQLHLRIVLMPPPPYIRRNFKSLLNEWQADGTHHLTSSGVVPVFFLKFLQS
jgi:hypothetical protein